MREPKVHPAATRTALLVLVAALVMTAWTVTSADKVGIKPTWRGQAKHDMLRIEVGMDGNVVYARDGKKLTGLNAADGTVKYQSELAGFEETGFWGEVEDTTYSLRHG